METVSLSNSSHHLPQNLIKTLIDSLARLRLEIMIEIGNYFLKKKCLSGCCFCCFHHDSFAFYHWLLWRFHLRRSDKERVVYKTKVLLIVSFWFSKANQHHYCSTTVNLQEKIQQIAKHKLQHLGEGTQWNWKQCSERVYVPPLQQLLNGPELMEQWNSRTKKCHEQNLWKWLFHKPIMW